MRRIAYSALASLLIVSASFGNAVIHLVSEIPQPTGGYEPGASLTVSVVISNQSTVARQLRGIQLDFTDTDGAIDLANQFEFDFSSRPSASAFYTIIELLPKPAMVCSSSHCDLHMLLITASPSSLRIGQLDVRLPPVPGNYLLDAFNRDDPNMNNGVFLTFGFGLSPSDPIVLWRADGTTPAGTLTGGNIVLTVAPEPGSLFLLAVGLLATLCRQPPLERPDR